MAPFRVAVRHTDRQHPNHGWFGFQHESLPELEHARSALSHARELFPQADGYEHRLQGLVATADGEDAAGQPVAVAHEWKDVKGG